MRPVPTACGRPSRGTTVTASSKPSAGLTTHWPSVPTRISCHTAFLCQSLTLLLCWPGPDSSAEAVSLAPRRPH